MSYTVSDEFINEFSKLSQQIAIVCSRFRFEKAVNDEKKLKLPRGKIRVIVVPEKKQKQIPAHYITTSQFEKKYKFLCTKSVKKLLKEINIDVIKFDRKLKNLYFNPLEFVFFFENGYFKHHRAIFNRYNLLKDKIPELIELRKSLPSK
jgi:hypothetical protein